MRIRVAVAGHAGKVGSVLAQALPAEPDFEYVGGVEAGDDIRAFLERTRPMALVDFTHPAAALANAIAAVSAGAAPIIGTTGIAAEGIDQLEKLCRERGVGGIVAPNFAVGAVLMMHLADIAAPFFEGVEVIEMHNPAKADAPSGTALATARRLAARGRFQHLPAERVTLEGARGGSADGVGVHSLRLPGLVADQSILFGLPGQTLTLTHRTTSREAFVPGVALAIRRLVSEPRFHRSLDALLGLTNVP